MPSSETTSLLVGDAAAGQNGTSRSNKNTKQRLVVIWVVVAAAVLIIAGLAWYYVSSRKAAAEAAAAAALAHAQAAAYAAAAAAYAKKQILYRPLCEVHSDRFSVATAVQSSMKDPSHPWSTVQCFATTSPSTKTSELNAYQAPDATLSVNLDTLAFPKSPAIMGFGGAFTEAAARNFKTLSPAGQQAVIDLLFGKDGLGYALGRIHMNSCDFSVESYSFDDVDGDFKLKHFDMTVSHDVATGMVEFAKRAVSTLRQEWGGPRDANETSATTADGNLRLYASPWSPPAWMKQPTWQDLPNATHAASMTYSTQPSCLRNGTQKESAYAAAWALYFSKYLTAYENLGLPFWGVTVQNEPEFAAPWEACSYFPDTERDFVQYHLGPQLEKDHPKVKLLIYDHNKDHVTKWARTLLNNVTAHASPYIDGTSYHWYAGGMDRLLDGALGNANLHRLQAYLQERGVVESHLVLGSEACHCPSTGYAGGDINVVWARAERYAHTVLADLAAGSHAWVEWNLILDGIGGPNHLGNLCESTILAVPYRAKDAPVDMPTLPSFEAHFPLGNVSIGDGRTREELNALGFPAKYLDVGVAVQPMYYYMGHITRHVRPGARAVPGLVTQPIVETTYDNITEAYQNADAAASRIFRPAAAVVAGGGLNDLARDGIEVTVWPCEGSTRQQFKWKNDSKRHIMVYGHDWLGRPTTSCMGKKEDVNLKGVRLVSCTDYKGNDNADAGVFSVSPVPGDVYGRVRILLQNPPRAYKKQGKLCLVIRELANDGGAYGPRGGAQVTLGTCDSASALWNLNENNDGEISSLFFAPTANNITGALDTSNSVCMTTGWPFLQLGAFTSETGTSKTVIVLNEANDPANYALVDDGELVLTGSIPARSVQTLTLEEEKKEDNTEQVEAS